ncbi:MAG: NAD(P)-binding domain-containing protein [Verrucomicrobiales bacterium]|nr:NAD(P)-binding domain-containing protein [Verrucomicrobiales bacterium]
MSTIAILGAGGKMGCRLTDNLMKYDHALLLVEISETGLANIAQRGLTPTPQAEALTRAEVLILALPDRLMSQIAHGVVPQLRPGTLVITLDPAVAHAGGLPPRSDISYFVTHPCHPSLFEHFETAAERDDFFGGIRARQAIVCALMQGPEAHYALGEGLARQFFGPVTRSHRITVEQMAILEPTMAEACGIALVLALREVLEEAVRRGVPRAAAEDFMYGHVKVELGIGFGRAGFPFSDGAKLIAAYGRERIFRDDWLKLFEPASVKEQVDTILAGRLPEPVRS